MSLQQPHDGLVQLFFSESQNVVKLLQANLPPALCAQFQWATLRRENASLIRPSFLQVHADFLFSIALRSNGAAYLHFLLEHQSSFDASMPLRMLDGACQIWVAHLRRREWPAVGLPFVFPIVISHVPGGWRTHRNLRELFNPATLAELEQAYGKSLVPDFSFILDDFITHDDDALRLRAATPAAALACWLLRDARRSAQFRRNLRHWAALFEGAACEESGEKSVFALLHYIHTVVKDVPTREVYDIIVEHAPAAKEAVMTLAEQLRAEGRSQGQAEGRRQGQAEGRSLGRAEGKKTALVETFRRLSKRRFGPLPDWAEGRLESASVGELERWAVALLDADSLEQVFRH